MPLGRREFLISAGTVAVSARSALAGTQRRDSLATPRQPARSDGTLPAMIRADFPAAANETYLNAAAIIRFGTFAADAIEQTLIYRMRGAGAGRADFGADKQQDLKKKFGTLINAQPQEIAFTSSTSDGENIVVMGLDLPRRGGNIVLDELHFTTSLYMYKELEKKGLELRIVKHRNWAIDIADVDKAIDKNTRLVSLALVSNVNGYMHDCKAISALAHARGALVFADIIQAVGAVPVDVKALGIDFAASGTYKWLMGERGLGFLYVREDLQGKVLPTTRYGHRQVGNFNRAALTWEPLAGAAMSQTGNIPVLLAACVSAGIDYVQRLGVDKIRAHARPLIERLHNELPPLGYAALTPRGTETPTVAFALKDAGGAAKALQGGKVAATIIANENRLRLSVSVFNNHDDIDRVVGVLGGKRSSVAV